MWSSFNYIIKGSAHWWRCLPPSAPTASDGLPTIVISCFIWRLVQGSTTTMKIVMELLNITHWSPHMTYINQPITLFLAAMRYPPNYLNLKWITGKILKTIQAHSTQSTAAFWTSIHVMTITKIIMTMNLIIPRGNQAPLCLKFKSSWTISSIITKHRWSYTMISSIYSMNIYYPPTLTNMQNWRIGNHSSNQWNHPIVSHIYVQGILKWFSMTIQGLLYLSLMPKQWSWIY